MKDFSEPAFVYIGESRIIKSPINMLNKYGTTNRNKLIQLHRRLIEVIRRKDVSPTKKQLLEYFNDVIAWSNGHRDRKI